jgi:hypothetical protein
MAVFVVTQTAFAVVYVAATTSNLSPEAREAQYRALGSNGDVLAVSTFLSTPMCLLAIFAIVKLRRGASLVDCLALQVPQRRDMVRWLAFLVAFAALADAATWLIGKPIVPEVMVEIYRTADNKGALWIAVILFAPLFEEVFFRGFVITGLSPSRLGASGAVLLSAAAWASIHGQYDAYWTFMIFLLGILLGAARVKTRSVVTPMIMHVVMNIIATAEVALL